MIIKLNIDVTKINKQRLHKGAKGIYANLTVLLRDEPDQYGNDGMIVEDVTKEERESGMKGTILGNAKIVGNRQAQAKQSPAAKDDKWIDDDSLDIPF
jgi:hypothetical protein